MVRSGVGIFTWDYANMSKSSKRAPAIGILLALILGVFDGDFVGHARAREKAQPLGEGSGRFGIGGCHINIRSVADFER